MGDWTEQELQDLQDELDWWVSDEENIIIDKCRNASGLPARV